MQQIGNVRTADRSEDLDPLDKVSETRQIPFGSPQKGTLQFIHEHRLKTKADVVLVSWDDIVRSALKFSFGIELKSR